ncbi:Os05g0152201 [Oryza sativa Japonica Group]|uniref:Os05g0152201 protein n=1 Tax=Oryza sativa subsp. japonica TaxID=39947 RepID=A0A0P0WI73_ORYSJ|nr:hypothetical protein EE612_027150 [Oryza sativa]BAS92324.1 Os05g0152201 [Oryza sativa Japonica Group]
MISQLFFPHRFLRSRHVSFLDSNSLCLCVAAASSQSNLVNCIFIEFFFITWNGASVICFHRTG